MKKWWFVGGVALLAATLGLWGLLSKRILLPQPSSFSSVSGEVNAPSSLPSVAPAALVSENAAAAGEASQKLQILNQIFESRDDNDPRLDREFNHLSAEAKRLLRDRYQQLPMEKRNERGTIVYLLGRNLTTPEDYGFFRQVLSEMPCLSMADCSKETRHDEESHRELGVDVTLAYPQLMALRQLQQQLESKTLEGERLSEAMRCLQVAKNSKIPSVIRVATELEQKFGSSGA